MNISACFILVLVFILSYFLSPFTIWYSNKLSMVDIPNDRSSHEVLTPSGGGIVFIIISYLGMLGYFLLNDIPDFKLLVILLGALAIGFVGWLDDFKKLSAKIRFGIQIFIVLISSIFLPVIWTAVPIVAEKAVIILAWVWFINLFNFIDGTDAYAAQEAVFICIGLSVLNFSIGYIALILGLAVLGFLRVNYPKAKIFMGDTGSIFLGYILGGFMILSIAEHKMTIIQAAVLSSLFAVDASYTLIKRGLQGKKVWKAHREHWYQRLNITGARHKVIFYIGITYNLIIMLLLVSNKLELINNFMLLVLALILLLYIALYIKKKEMKISGKKK